ncbi:hypothetical protein CB0940_11681 [Cercospora beticola]|uniref:Uncharacterized protein n=1 Tax=Cercospora beticola TaxID=122368 RepID=A0A2G5IEV2_CERBT|nr:hypothetical protein CB0940_11681 [Cercospora beticola]PIB03260.1 hypothetical protein CB0940_11681 [Cercospora beticola]WPB04036.1 hypothetical protein RHO25_008680 [Cercospora beticola]
MASPGPPPRCMLFELSAELRNVIYEQVLIISDCNDYIQLEPATGLQVPALLQVCHQVRNEAAQMYFEENFFQLWLMGCSPRLLYEWIEMATRYVGRACVDGKLNDRSIDYNTYDNEDPSNIIQWCKLVREGKLPAWDCSPEDIKYGSACPTVVAGQRLAMQMKFRPWAEFVAAFELLHYAVEGTREQIMTLNLIRY